MRQDTDLTNPSMTSIAEEVEIDIPREEYYSEPRVSPVEVELSELSDSTAMKKMVNIHQFYPQLEHTFTKSSTKFAEEQDKRTEEAMKEIVDETTFSNSDKELSSASQLQMQLEDNSLVHITTDSEMGEEEGRRTNDDNNSAADKKVNIVVDTAG